MFQTVLLLKLKAVTNDGDGVRARVKLAKQIQGAKFIEVDCDLSHVKTTLGFRCDLVDGGWTNLESIGDDKTVERAKETTTVLLFKRCGDKTNMVPVLPSKSIIDEFVLDVLPLRGSGMGRAVAAEAFVQVKIHHTVQ